MFIKTILNKITLHTVDSENRRDTNKNYMGELGHSTIVLRA